MSSQHHHQQPGAEGASLNMLGLVTAKLAEYGQNARHNVSDGLNQMTPQSWIRLVIIVGGYMLLRQYIIKHSTKVAVKKLEEQEAADKEAAKVSPNELRGLKAQIPDEDADEGADGTGADWGSKARVRQRKFLREMLEAEERRREEDDDDADIKEFLVD